MEERLSESGGMADSPGLKHGGKAVRIRQLGRQSRAKTWRKCCQNQEAWQTVQGGNMEARLSESCSMVDSSEMEHGSKAVRIRIGFHKIKQNFIIDFLEINKACIIVFTVLSWQIMHIFSVPESRRASHKITLATACVVAASIAVAAASIKTAAGLA
jgi:hypothetical protein